MNLDAQPMSCTVTKRFGQAMPPQRAARRRVDVSRPNTGLDRSDCRALSLQHGLIDPSHFRIGLPYSDRAGQVDAVSAVDPAKVQHDQVPLPECPVPRMGMGPCGIRSAGDNRLERAALETRRI